MVTTKHCYGVCRSDWHYVHCNHMNGVAVTTFPKLAADVIKCEWLSESDPEKSLN